MSVPVPGRASRDAVAIVTDTRRRPAARAAAVIRPIRRTVV